MRNLDDFAVCQNKSGNVDGVHEGVFADRSVRQAITVATRIGALGQNADDRRPETFLCRGLHLSESHVLIAAIIGQSRAAGGSIRTLSGAGLLTPHDAVPRDAFLVGSQF